jgi:hypothetical protein
MVMLYLQHVLKILNVLRGSDVVQFKGNNVEKDRGHSEGVMANQSDSFVIKHRSSILYRSTSASKSTSTSKRTSTSTSTNKSTSSILSSSAEF